jgi:osmotically-inducible protein OsmY
MTRRHDSSTVRTAQRVLQKRYADQELKEKIEAQRPVRDKQDELPELEVEVTDGYVQLKGFVRTYREKERLHRFAMALPGVKALKDLVRVRPLESLADRQVALHVRQALDAHAELPEGTVTVHARNGVCSLQGYVRSAEERHIAEQVASHCRGVIQVLNELSVDTLEEASDEATAQAVKGSCNAGVVVLRGQVATLLDRYLVEEMSRIQPGVKAIENHLQVEPDRVYNHLGVVNE